MEQKDDLKTGNDHRVPVYGKTWGFIARPREDCWSRDGDDLQETIYAMLDNLERYLNKGK